MKALAAFCMLAALWVSCTHTINTEATISIRRVSLVRKTERLDTLDANKANEFRKTHADAGACVVDQAVETCYWQDDLKIERVMLSATKTKSVDVVRVDLVGMGCVREIKGKRNGRSFESADIIDCPQ